MRLFKQPSLTLYLTQLTQIQEACAQTEVESGSATRYPASQWKSARELFGKIEDLCDASGFDAARSCVNLCRSNHPLDTVIPTVAALEAEVRMIYHMLMSDVWKSRFILVQHEHVRFIDNDALFGPEVQQAFPSASADLREGGNCLATDCNTAAVFHLMRAVEWGLRGFCVDLGFAAVRSHKKSGRRIYTPVEFSTWEKILDQLPDAITKKVNSFRKRVERQAAQEFYYSAMQEFRAIKDAWRNHVMHTRSEYNAADAEAIRSHVERFLKMLATRIRES